MSTKEYHNNSTLSRKKVPAFTIVAAELILDQSLSPVAKIVCIYLAYRQGRKKDCWPRQETIAEDLAISVGTVKKAIAELEQASRVGVTRPEHRGPGNCNRYSVRGRVKPQKTQPEFDCTTPEHGQNLTLLHGQNLTNNYIQGTIDSSAATILRPTPVEVREYASSIGYTALDADHFCEYYGAADWHLPNGTPIRNWKQMVLAWKQREREPEIEDPFKLRPPTAEEEAIVAEACRKAAEGVSA